MIAVLGRLRGEARRQLLLVSTLYFGILFLESSVGHVPLLSADWKSLAILPVIVLPLSLLSLMLVIIVPAAWAAACMRIVMIVAAVVGVVGVFPHLAANGVAAHQLQPVFSGAVFHGEPGPTWPIAIAFGGVLGFIGSFGVAGDEQFARAVREAPIRWVDKLGFALLVVAIVLSPSLTTLGWACVLTVAAVLVLALNSLVGLIALARGRRNA